MGKGRRCNDSAPFCLLGLLLKPRMWMCWARDLNHDFPEKQETSQALLMHCMFSITSPWGWGSSEVLTGKNTLVKKIIFRNLTFLTDYLYLLAAKKPDVFIFWPGTTFLFGCLTFFWAQLMQLINKKKKQGWMWFCCVYGLNNSIHNYC